MTNIVVAAIFFAVGYGLTLLNTESKDIDRHSKAAKVGFALALISLVSAAIL